MPAPAALIAAWARSAVVPRGGAFSPLESHEIAAPVLQALLQRGGISPRCVDAVVIGNALGAGGNPARMLALAAGLPEHSAAYSLDTQCCSGLDAASMAVGLIASGQASVVVAGGVEAWTRAPIRLRRPLREGEPALPYDRPAFAPDPQRDPDMLVSAARYALQHQHLRKDQDLYAVNSHWRALAHRIDLRDEIVPVAGVHDDAYPRVIDAARAARMPTAVKAHALGSDWQSTVRSSPDCSISPLGISAKADGAALILLASTQACERLRLQPRAAWIASATVGSDPQTPLIAAERATREALQRAGLDSADALSAIELHDAFAVQGLSFCQGLGLSPDRINRRGGGLARGHPIGASAAMALVRLLADLALDGRPGDLGLTAVAGAGGTGAAAIVQCQGPTKA